MLVLNAREVESLLDLDELIGALSPAMAALSAGEVSMPPRIGAMVRDYNGILGVMPVYVGPSRILETKLVSIYPDNEARGLPSHLAIILVFDPATGAPLALMDGTYITAVRTAAGSALATRILARPDADALVIVGTGVQARTHGRAIPRVRSVREIRVVGRSESKARALADELHAELGITAKAAASFQEAAAGADVICATTHSAEPVVLGKFLEPGVHVNSVGLNPAGRELDGEAITRSLVVVESRQSALAPPPGGANDLLWPIRDGLITEAHIHAEIGEIIAGRREGRASPSQITLYKSVGVAVQDAVAAQLVLSKARERGIGVEVNV
ncbi:MAG: ornithine cyclodeaminase family protein [Chloroflexi bacterium]|nr:ornithine cyclodeaminase family protein [Chloroflexota bacterium]